MDSTIIISIIAGTVRIATPILLAALGLTLTNLAGIMNLGVEGIILTGAFVGFLTAYHTGSLSLAILTSLIAGGLVSLILAFLAINLKADQTVSGLAINLFASGITAYLYRVVFNITSTAATPSINTMKNIKIPLLSKIPIVGEVLFSQNLLTYIAFLMVPIIWFFINKTKYGLEIRCLGENPRSITTRGINIDRLQYLAVIFGGMMGGLGGAFLTLASAGIFVPGISAGRGWLAIVVVIAGNWAPIRIVFATMAFSFLDAFQLQVQGSGVQFPYQVLLALPYVIAIVLMTISRTRSQAPSSMGVPYFRE